jgi:GT2 family glycosyltransferase
MISVIIVNYQSASLTERAVKSVFQAAEAVEVIVIDNASTEAEKKLLHRLLKDYDVSLVFNKDNVGFAKANNQAFAMSKGQYIFLLNPDAYIIPPCLSTLRIFLENTPEASSVAPLIFWDTSMTYLFPRSVPPSPFRDIFTKLSRRLPVFGHLYSLSERRKNIKLWKSSSPVRVKNLSGGSAMLKRSAIEDAGGLFDEQFFLFYEDSDLFLRLRKAGYHLHVVPSAKAVHSHKHTGIKLDIMAQTRALFYKKHFDNRYFKYLFALLPDPSQKGKYADSGDWDTPPLFSVPPTLRKSYLFEWSPDPLFIPSVGHFGKGETLCFPEEIWNSLDQGHYFSRFTDAGKLFCQNQVLHWRKV